MGLNETDRKLLAAIGDGLPITPRPYALIGERLGFSEQQVIERIERLIDDGIVSRFGVVVRHHELGYDANAMVVWDVPCDAVDRVAAQLAAMPPVTLCYQRPRRLPDWPYNLFCMIHGRSRQTVEDRIREVSVAAGIEHLPRAVLFSRRRFKQRGARFQPAQAPVEATAP